MTTPTTEKKSLRELRTTRRLTQTQLADQVGCTMFTVINWERGKNAPHPDHFKRLLEVLDVTADEIDLVPIDFFERAQKWTKYGVNTQ